MLAKSSCIYICQPQHGYILAVPLRSGKVNKFSYLSDLSVTYVQLAVILGHAVQLALIQETSVLEL